MAADIDERQRKRKRVKPRKKFLVNDKVEVRSVEEGFLGSWYSGVVIFCEDKIRHVQYDYLLCDDGVPNVIDTVQVSPMVDGIIPTNWAPSNYRGLIRPLPPPLEFGKWYLHYGQCVDVFYADAWWEGVIFDHEDGSEERLVFFPETGDVLNAKIEVIRITQDWDENNDEWKPRGDWLFLEVIEEVVQEWPPIVSVRQIWYEVRVKNGYENLKEWTSSARDVWKELVLQVYYDNLKLTSMENVHRLNSSGDLGQDGHYSWMELFESALDALLKPTTCQSDRDELLPNDLDKTIQPFEENNDRDDLKLPAISIMPKHEEAICVQPPAFSILPSKSDEFSRVSSNSNGKVSSDTGSKLCRRRTWLPASPYIVSRAEYCPDAVSEYIKESGYRCGASTALTSNVRKHLLQLGWEIKYIRDSQGIQRVSYTSPDGKKRYNSLRLLCMDLTGSASKVVSLFPQCEQRSLAAVSDSPSSSMETFLDDDDDEEEEEEEEKEEEDDSDDDGHVSKPKWLLAGRDIVPEPKYCPEAISEYLNGSRPKGGALTAATCRKHLSYLGWKIEFLKSGLNGSIRFRYTSPDSSKSYMTLRAACMELASGTLSLIPQDDQKSLAAVALPDSPISPPLIGQPQVPNKARKRRKLSSDDDVVFIEPEYFPQAVVEYCSFGLEGKDYVKGGPNFKDLVLKAKKHLSAVGWTFFYVRKGTRRELRYCSPSGKKYISLLTACRQYMKDGATSYPDAHAYGEETEC